MERREAIKEAAFLELWLFGVFSSQSRSCGPNRSRVMTDCDVCRDWGRTIDPVELDPPTGAGFLVQCGACKRLTWPNLGVNLPAGAATALVAAQAQARIVEIAGKLYTYDSVSLNPKTAAKAAIPDVGRLLESERRGKRTVTEQDHRAFLKRVAKRRARKKMK